jgi:cell division septation protein DedD
MSHLAADRLASLAAGAEPDDAEATHLFECAACAAACEPPDAVELVASLRRLEGSPAPDRMRAMEDALVAASTAKKRARIAVVAAPLVAIAIAAAWLFFARSPADHPTAVASHADVTMAPGARVETTSAGTDEVVELSGTARFSVRKLAPGDRYRVRARADELEVRGTAFSIDADFEGFRAVTVTEGLVEVRPACCAATRLSAGERWVRPADPPAPSATPVAPVEPIAPSPTPTTTAASPPEVPAADLLAKGTAAYDAGNYGVAADLLRRATRAEPGASWARDATVLAGAAGVLMSSPDQIASSSASVASLDAAAKRAARAGDARRAVMAQLAAARRSSGASRRSRYCALRDAAGLPAAFREEAARGCSGS